MGYPLEERTRPLLLSGNHRCKANKLIFPDNNSGRKGIPHRSTTHTSEALLVSEDALRGFIWPSPQIAVQADCLTVWTETHHLYTQI